MIAFPNCKINIGLNILRKRPDGFHDIETLFCPLELSDILEITPSDESSDQINLTVTGLKIDCMPEKNLCVRAYDLLKSQYELPPVNVHLHKVNPSGAGLGGGSSDAAFMLRMLSELFKLGLSEDELCDLASTLGSDCAFFIKNRILFGYGRGNIFYETEGISFHGEVVVIHPGIHVGTAEAYAAITPKVPERRLEELVRKDISEWKNHLKNDFEDSIFLKHPLIKEIRDRLYKSGAVYASMSGSGSAVYGLFTENSVPPPDLFPGMFYWRGTLDYGV